MVKKHCLYEDFSTPRALVPSRVALGIQDIMTTVGFEPTTS